jgi:hypothetical protein
LRKTAVRAADGNDGSLASEGLDFVHELGFTGPEVANPAGTAPSDATLAG